MGPNVKILMGQSFGSWTHGHGPMALGAWAAAAGPPPPGKVRVRGRGGRRRPGSGFGEFVRNSGTQIVTSYYMVLTLFNKI